jgi:prepilin-type N-terminal cleavage/methylation domain-containing protein
MGRPSTTRARLRGHDDSGFTLVEAVVALMVLGIIFTALAAASIGSLRASLSSRAEQQAIDFATQALERARQTEYYALGHDATEIATDSANVDPCDTTWCFNPGDGAEELVIMPGGSVNPHVQTVSSDINNGTNFTVATYVTRPLNSGADVKRVTVVTRWNVGSTQRERVSSSMVTATTRGLPIPLFNFETAANSQAVNPAVEVTDPDPIVAFQVQLTNQGAPDRWDLTIDSGTWTFWRDNGDNILCMVSAECGPGVDLDTPLTDSDDAGTAIDTGRLDPTTAITFWAVREVPETTLGDYWNTLTATAVSLSQGSGDTAAGVRTLKLRTIVTNDVITGLPGGGTPSTSLPTAPRDLMLTIDDGQLTAAWTAPEAAGTSAITDYVVEYRVAGAPTWTSESDVSTDLTRVLTGLTNGTLYEVHVAARNASGVGPFGPAVQATPSAGTPYTAPSFCPVTNPAILPVPAKAGGFTLWNYALHNRSAANPGWPGTGIPSATRTDVQGIPLNMIKDGPEFATGTNLPVYSEDISNDPGRVILPGGSLASPDTDTEYVVDWRTDLPGKRYSGTAVLTFWVAPAGGSTATSYQLAAQLYKATATDTTLENSNIQGLTSNGNSPSNPVATADTLWCTGYDWQQVAIALPIDMKKAMAGDEFLGVRLWNIGTESVRVGYDVAGDFPAFLTVPEK